MKLMRVCTSAFNGLMLIFMGFMGLLLCGIIEEIEGFLIANLNSDSKPLTTSINVDSLPFDYRIPLKLINICVDCDDPAVVGSFIVGMEAKFGVREYDVTGELVYCVPNLADGQILNGYQFAGRIVMVNRGVNTFWEKVSKIQSEGAAAVLIADDGSCGYNDQFVYCGARVGSLAEGGFAANDDKELWTSIKIPVLLVSAPSAERLRTLMKAKLTDVIKLGSHYVNEVNENKNALQIDAINSNERAYSIFDSIAIENKKEKRKLYGHDVFGGNARREKERQRREREL